MTAERFADEVYGPEDLARYPPEYKKAIGKIVVSHAVNELKGALTFDEPAIRMAPTPKFKWLVSRNTMEEFNHHILFARLAEAMGLEWKDKKPLTIFDYPMVDWAEFGAIKAVVDIAELIELDDLISSTYLPLRKVAKDTYPDEKFHVGLGRDIVRTLLIEDATNRARLQTAFNELVPRTLDFFGSASSENNETFVRWGLKKRSNEAMRQEYFREVREYLLSTGFTMPPVPEKYRKEIAL
ncbi:MAG: phenylacetate-CoA oxygenase subunit PaaI [Candidatus Thermoplasmatota archaeon]|jgi:ring-1,2-phenylacetyl-CoA epoxidase subunit PaaA|nr:phenylacetate-CoA oxygenase subunit PaaI [Candidatus Thermoplasmatota archaeon]MCL5983895.1 phenylacetate-CoA oxygenase subunit PaaI [Candidatus Thermoplasmatota archaeon]